MKDVNIYIYTQFHGSLSNGSGKAHVIWETMIKDEKGKEIPFTKKRQFEFKDVTKNKLELLALKEALLKMRKKSRITIYMDSQYVVSAISNGWLDTWAESGFIKKGKAIKHADLWRDIETEIEKHEVLLIQGKTEYTKIQEFELKGEGV